MFALVEFFVLFDTFQNHPNVEVHRVVLGRNWQIKFWRRTVDALIRLYIAILVEGSWQLNRLLKKNDQAKTGRQTGDKLIYLLVY